MNVLRNVGFVVASGLMLAACESSFWPAVPGDDAPSGKSSGERIDIPPSKAEAAARAQNKRGTGPISTMPAVAAKPVNTQPKLSSASTGTFVGKKVDAMRGDLGKLQKAVGRLDERMRQIRGGSASATNRYYGVVAAIDAKLQAGTTPGNPVLVQQWNEAQKQLKRIEASISQMNNLSNDAGSEASVAGYLLDSVRATYTLSGAVDQDHVDLRALEDEVNQSVVVIDRLLNELSEDLNRQTTYLANERRNLTAMSIAIKNGERYGASLANRAFAQAEVKASLAARTRGPDPAARPLVVIRFDRSRVNYERVLYNAVSRALERKPGAAFDIVAVSPRTGSAAQVVLNSTAVKRNAESVMRTLSEMGLPSSRVNLIATSIGSAQSNEVRIYVR